MTRQTNQNYSNHRRYVPLYHFVLLGIVTILILASGIYLGLSFCHPEDIFAATLLFVISISLGLVSWYARAFAIKAQNRAIRAEENLRYFAATGKLLPKELKMSQIVALRFAPDEEFLDLVSKALANNLSNEAIKEEIKNWRADHHRA